jgi:hypothetical protein
MTRWVKFRLPGSGGASLGWADLVVVPLIVILAVPPLIWFGQYWTINSNDTTRYLLAGSQLITGQALEGLNNISDFNGNHGPTLPVIIGLLILVFDRDIAELVWALRVLALVNPLLAYLLVRRISTPVAGLIAAALVSLLAYNVESAIGIIVDVSQLTFYLLSLLVLLAAIGRGGSPLAVLSGVVLGVCILTKESGIVDLPLALLAVLLLDWEVRWALWHYLGLILTCLPWWAWVYSATGEVYLVGRLPAGMSISLLIAALVLLALAAGAYVSGMVDRFLASERRRRWSGWFVVLAWTVALTGLLLATSSHALGKVTLDGSATYLSHVLAPAVFVVPTLLVVLAYAVWKAIRERGAWMVLALAMLFQVPVCVMLTVQSWALRQFLIPQVLVFCVLAALLVAAGTAAWRDSNILRRLSGATVACALSALLLVASVHTVRVLLSGYSTSVQAEQVRLVAPLVAKTSHWMTENVPEGERILYVSEPGINIPRADYLMFLDAGRHQWTRLKLDQGVCVPRPNAQINCDPDQDAISNIPPEPLWVQRFGTDCRVISLSAPNLLEQSRRSGADYVVIAGDEKFPPILDLPSAIRASGTFGLANAYVVVSAPGVKEGVALLKSTGRTARAAPTSMNVNTALGLRRCAQAGSAEQTDGLDSRFPHGVVLPNQGYIRRFP